MYLQFFFFFLILVVTTHSAEDYGLKEDSAEDCELGDSKVIIFSQNLNI